MLYKSYNTLILPVLYCASVRDSCGVGCKAHLDKLNRRAACIIENAPAKYNNIRTHLASWPGLQTLREYLKCVLVYKYLNGMAPSHLVTEYKYTYQFHSYKTRQRIESVFAKTSTYQNSFRIGKKTGQRNRFSFLLPKIRKFTKPRPIKIDRKRHLNETI